MPVNQSVAIGVSDALRNYAASPPKDTADHTWDFGPILLTSLADECIPGAKGPCPAIEDVCKVWLNSYPGGAFGLALIGGVSSVCFGLFNAKHKSHAIEGFYQRIRRGLVEQMSGGVWSNPARDWPDYDLIMGPSGALISLSGDETVAWDEVSGAVRQLVRLLDSEDMESFRITGCKDDELRGWNYRSINLGLAHGVGGPIAALSACVRRFGRSGDGEVERVLSKAADWFVEQAHEDTAGIITWSPKRQDVKREAVAPSRREAWCYGAPGLAWVLWDAGSVLRRPDLQSFAADVFCRYASRFDKDFHLDTNRDGLAICHGAAGIMLVADAFARHAGLREGLQLEHDLESLLLERLPQVLSVSQVNPTFLSGGMGVLSALLTVQGAERTWLVALALR